MKRHSRRFFPACALAALILAPATEAQPGDLDAWHVVSTPHFVIHTNATPERGGEIAVSLELFRGVFARLAPSLELRSPAPTKILAFRDARSFAPYKTRPDSGGARVLGQFMSHPDGNYLTLDAGAGMVGAFAVVYHEYVHYFVRHNFPSVPLWFNEGLAEYYSTFAVEDGVVHIGRPVERHVRFLERDPEFSLYDLLAVTRESADYHEGSKAGRFYAVSWALVHYLLSGGRERADQTADFLLALQDGEEPYDAFESAFDTRISRVEEELRSYIVAGDYPKAAIEVSDLDASVTARSRRARPQDTLFHLGDLLVHMGRRQAAENHFHLALDYEPEHPEAHAGLALVRDLGNRFGEAQVLFEVAVPASSDPLVYLLYGRHLLQRLQAGDGDPEELAAAARQALATAKELDSEYAEAYALFGMAHLVGDVDPAPGIDALTKARSWLPERHDVTMNLLRLYLKDEDFDRAEWLFANAIEGRAGAELTFQAREEIDRTRLVEEAAAALEEGDAERAVELYDEAISITSDAETRERMEVKLRELQGRING